MKQDLEKMETVFLSSDSTSRKSSAVPGDASGNKWYQKEDGKVFVKQNKTTKRDVQNAFLGRKIVSVKTDGGLEFCNKDLDNFLEQQGINHEKTNPYTPEQNGVAERYNLTALDGVKTLLKSSGVAQKFWGEALLCFTYTWNRVCHKDGNKTPFEKYSGKKPSVSHLKPFGCLEYVGVPKQLRKRLDMRAKLESPSTSREEPSASTDSSLIPCSEIKWIRKIGREVTGAGFYYGIEGKATRLKSFNEIERYCREHKIHFDKNLFDFSGENTKSEKLTDSAEGQLEANVVEVKIPTCYQQAIRSREASEWCDAMDREINVMIERKVWVLVDPPENAKVLGNRWVYTLKRDENNRAVRFKARRHNIIFGKEIQNVDFVLNLLQDNFDLKVLSRTKKLLGIEFEEQGNDLFIHQKSYIERVCRTYEKYKFPVSSLPISKGQVLSKLDLPKTSEELLNFPYRNLIGSLAFIALRTRPDIMYAINVLSQFQSNLGIKHWNCLLRLLGYLKYTQNYMLELSKVKSLKLRCFSDSDFATNRDDRVSIGGFITFIDETPISWRTFKQKSGSLSTMEAESVALTEAAKEFIWLKNVLNNESLNLKVNENIMFCDNQAAISFSNSPVENYRTKHIDVRYHFLRNLIHDNVFKIQYVNTKFNLADIITKPMVKDKLLEFCRNIFST
ncbi:Retrovirus-related Pol polyprotein from transposon TNT 1-94 [Araneus ventricosus]|uniref:Retrovirus-related Pol polyprotein from transposon TNT 1-94 n=1 Tax=Araneus ventricosus TaxID=182803 RepID=A0A4Y2A928_ARAVE|nr:Retrovirus-related Pol polyprotein from transposon TNT 1-94 [Araneus ventricosus]